MTDCECPCAWVDAKNYTEDELKMAVKKIQEKLLVSKDALSQQVSLQQHFNEVYGVFLPKLQTSVSSFLSRTRAWPCLFRMALSSEYIKRVTYTILIYVMVIHKLYMQFFLFRVQCWSQFIVPVHGREWGRESIHKPSYKVVIVYTFHLSNCYSFFTDNATCEYCLFVYVVHCSSM